MAALAAGLLGSPPAGLDRCGGGGNNRVLRVQAGDGTVHALKLYPMRSEDRRDRLGTEFGGLEFLARHGVPDVMRPVRADRANAAALYRWIEGTPPGPAGEADVDQAVRLAARLAALAGGADAMALPHASEACLSGAELERQVAARADRLSRLAGGAAAGTPEAHLARLLERRLQPCRAAALEAGRRGYRRLGLDFEAPLPAGRQTLSPSDFGFHNALRLDDGALVFIDFEYFGRDDPVKLAADFLLHPGMALDAALRRRFRDGIETVFVADPTFLPRLDLLLPLYAVRWTLILLNEFLPERWAGRAWANPGLDRVAVLRRQLRKAEAMLDLAETPNAVYEGVAA